MALIKIKLIWLKLNAFTTFYNLTHEWLVLSFELSQRQNLPHAAHANTIFSTEDQQTKKELKKKFLASRYESHLEYRLFNTMWCDKNLISILK